ncbi:MAG: hypothetical protein AAFY71_03505 [Bacteroidota bacterium]
MLEEENIMALAEKLVFEGLSEEEKEQIQQEILSNSSYKELFEKHVALNMQLLREADERKKIELKELLLDLPPELEEAKVKRFGPMSIVLAVAAAIALLILAYVAFPSQQKNINTAELFAANFEPYYPDNLRSNDSLSRVDSLLKVANGLVRSDQCQEAKLVYDEVLKTGLTIQDQRLRDIPLYQASCLMKIGNYQEALSLLTGVSGGDQEAIIWYRSLALLGLDQVKEAKEFLHQIAQDQSSFYQGQAKELSSILEKSKKSKEGLE